MGDVTIRTKEGEVVCRLIHDDAGFSPSVIPLTQREEPPKGFFALLKKTWGERDLEGDPRFLVRHYHDSVSLEVSRTVRSKNEHGTERTMFEKVLDPVFIKNGENQTINTQNRQFLIDHQA